MLIGLSGQGKIVFFSCHEAFSFVSKIIVIILTADPDDRIGIQVSLLNEKTGVVVKIRRQFFDRKFAFDFHKIVHS